MTKEKHFNDIAVKIVDEADMLKIGAITIASRGEPTMHKKYSEMFLIFFRNVA